ncbi:MAG: hypothetical protein AAF533_13070 [Acidobacteriota bacterium]
MTARIPQAVVTDPAPEEGAGYMVASQSSGVQRSESVELDAAVGATDWLHEASAPGTYFSFYRLEEGNWIFVRRFVRGKRRHGAYNRIVGHCLILDSVVLDAIRRDPWLLTVSKFQRVSNRDEFSLVQLGESAACLPPVDLEDLILLAPDESIEASDAIADRRRARLIKTWGHEQLVRRLATIHRLLSKGERVCLPQDPDHEWLTALAWHALPPRDRLNVPWTTHLAPPRDKFRLATSPGAPPVGWSGYGKGGATSGAVWLEWALLVVDGGETFRDRWDGMEEHGLSLLERPDELQRYLRDVQEGLVFVTQGFSSAPDLAERVRRMLDGRKPESLDPWQATGSLWSCAVGTARAEMEAGNALVSAARLVVEALGPLRRFLPGEACLEQLRRAQGALDATGAEPVLLILEMVQQALPAGGTEAHRRRLFEEVDVEAVIAAVPVGTDAIGLGPLLELAVGVLRDGESARERAKSWLRALSGVPGVLGASSSLVTGRSLDDLRPALALFDVGTENDTELAADIVAGPLSELLETPGVFEQLGRERVGELLPWTRRHGEVLAGAIARWPGDAGRLAAGELRAWLDDAPGEALLAARALLEELDNADQPVPAATGLARAVHRAHPSDEIWVQLVIHEATAVDDRGTTEGTQALVSWLSGQALPLASRAEVTRSVLTAVEGAARSGRVGEALRVLTDLVRPGLASCPAQAVASLSAVLQCESAPLAQWVPTLHESTRELGQTREGRRRASQLRRQLIMGLPALLTSDPSLVERTSELLSSLSEDSPSEQQEVLRRWVTEVPALLEAGRDDVVRTLATVTREGHRGLHYRIQAEILRSDLRRGRLGEREAFLQADLLLQQTEMPDDGRLIESLMPESSLARLQSCLGVLTSLRMTQTLKHQVEEHVLERVLAELGGRAWHSGIDVKALMDRPAALASLATHLGRHWREHRETARIFLSSCVSHSCTNAMACLLEGTEHAGWRRGLLKHLIKSNQDYLVVTVLSRARASAWRFESLAEPLERAAKHVELR